MGRSYRALAEYYDAEYEGAPSLARDVPFFLEHLPKKKQRVLELCVGTARAGIPIAQAGHGVVGVDYDEAMLRIARRKRDYVGLSEAQLSLRRQDALKLRLTERFDWAAIFFNTFLNFTTLQQQDRLLRNIRSHLKPRGRLWIDVFNPDLAMLAPRRAEHLDQSTFYVPSLNRTVDRDTEVRATSDAQVQQVTFHYRWTDPAGEAKHEQVAFDMTAIFPREMRILLERNGYAIEHMFGDYDCGAVVRDSPRIIVVASREFGK